MALTPGIELSGVRPLNSVSDCCMAGALCVLRHTREHRVQNNNNNKNTIWGGSGVESCSPPSRRPNPIPAIPPYVVRTPHLHGAPTTEETV